MFLKEFVKDCEILYFKQPYKVFKVDYRKIIRELWQTDISDSYPEDVKIKKLIANVIFGLLEKMTNTASKSYSFDDLREALYYQHKVGGRINKIASYYDEEVEIDTDEFEMQQKENDKKHYCLTVSDRTQLKNGYVYIKELLLQHHNHKMYHDYNKLRSNHIDIWSVKTDAFVIRKDHLRLAKKVLDFNEHIGGWRHEKGKHIVEPADNYKQKANELIPISVYTNETYTPKDEWNTREIAEYAVTHSPFMIRSKFAGGGKSHIAKYMSNLGYNTLFVVPNNSLSQDIKNDAVTVNKFFAIPVGDGERLPEFDHSPYNCIIFDEIYMNGLRVKNCIRQFVQNNPTKIIIGAGDAKQLPPVNEDITNTRDADEYADECINLIFKHNILLTICKRLGPKDDPIANKNREMLDQMYSDMWIHKIKLKDLVYKYFNTTDEVVELKQLQNDEVVKDALHNIAYTNMRCLNVSSYIRKHLGKKDKYEVGEILVCRLYKKYGNNKFNVNYRYRIKELKPTVILENVKSKECYMTDLTTLDKHFRYNYCTTCHSAQGSSIDGKIIIHEWDKENIVTREWLWCALTRSTDFNKVRFFKGECYKNELNEETLAKYIETKIKNYQIKDENADRDIDVDKYVNHEWFMKRLTNTCCNCGCRFEFEIKNGNLTSNMTAQRLDNEQPHHIDNCEAWCRGCNTSAK